jgi:hypothetical protein
MLPLNYFQSFQFPRFSTKIVAHPPTNSAEEPVFLAAPGAWTVWYCRACGCGYHDPRSRKHNVRRTEFSGLRLHFAEKMGRVWRKTCWISSPICFASIASIGPTPYASGGVTVRVES